ncbi:MAG: hypothetical protein QMD04_02745 [Anaerolineales bacterium]|nr:hypothetical protein [Anaerolineales bacterium]
MRDWYLGLDDPLTLTLAADFRLCSPDYLNDQIWELQPGDGDPPALSLRTTYGLRARSMRIFPRFTANGKTVTAPASFAAPPRLRRFHPNFLALSFSPFVGAEVMVEYWIPSSQTIAGRLTFINHANQAAELGLELCALLVPLEGQSLAQVQIQSVNVLAGHTSDLAPVIFMTGGARHGPGPYPSLTLDLHLEAGVSRQLTWAQAALDDPQASFELARRTAARIWDGERARVELVNAAQTVEVRTGDPDWDAAFALSQKTAFNLFFPGNENLPNPSFVLARQPDHGYSRRADGSDYSHLWSGQSPLEAYYLASLLPGSPDLAGGLLRNFLFTQDKDGFIDCRPGLGGQRGCWLSPPLLASLAWRVYQATENEAFLADVFPHLLAFFQAWFAPAHDRDRDGFPEWDHPLQTGFEDNPAYAAWHDWAQGVDIATLESPALAASLYAECRSLIQMAEKLGRAEDLERLRFRAEALRIKTEECWSAAAGLYHYRDRDTHLSLVGETLAQQHGSGRIQPKHLFSAPVRLLMRVRTSDKAFRRLAVTIQGQTSQGERAERLEGQDIQWNLENTTLTSREVYSRLDGIEITGLKSRDRVTIATVDHTREDQTLFLPLWAGIPEGQRAWELINRGLLDPDRFYRPFGLSACASVPCPPAEAVCLSVQMPWQQLIGEGLLAYGHPSLAAQLIARLMNAIILNLKQQRAFYSAYHAETGAGIGERNALAGLAPLGLFLQTLGVQFLPGSRVRLSGKNPFPWPVTVKYRGLSVTRHSDQSEVTFPDGRSVALSDPSNALVCPE